MKKFALLVLGFLLTAAPAFASAHLASRAAKKSAKVSAKAAKVAGAVAVKTFKFVF